MTNALGGALGVQQYVLLFLWGVLLWGVCREVRDFIGMPRRGRARRPRWREAKPPVPAPVWRATRPVGVGGGSCRRGKEKRSRTPERKGSLRPDPFVDRRRFRL